jgi:hypothetical protein
VAVEKVRESKCTFACDYRCHRVFLSPQRSGSFHTEWCWLAEVPRQSLDVLGGRCQKELLAHELYANDTSSIRHQRRSGFA